MKSYKTSLYFFKLDDLLKEHSMGKIRNDKKTMINLLQFVIGILSRLDLSVKPSRGHRSNYTAIYAHKILSGQVRTLSFV